MVIAVRARALLRLLRRLLQPIASAPLTALTQYPRYWRDRRRFVRLGGDAPIGSLFPMLADRGREHPLDSHYVIQAHWATSRLLATSPPSHVDVASHLEFAASVAALLPVTYVDLRQPALRLPGFEARAGTLASLPFEDGSLTSVSCLHVIEHVGLGRYGDPIDPHGLVEAASELTRVLAIGGRLLVSVPVGRPRTEFNAHRILSPKKVAATFASLRLRSFALVDDEGTYHESVELDHPWVDRLEYGCGMFEFERER